MTEASSLSGSAVAFDAFVDELETRLDRQFASRSPGASLQRDLGLDSIAMFEFLLVLEEMVDRLFPDALILSMETLGDAWGWVSELGSD